MSEEKTKAELMKELEMLRENERQFCAVWNGTFQFIALLKPDGSVVRVNRAGLATADAPADANISGTYFWEAEGWNTPQAEERLKASIVKAAKGEFVRYETEIETTKGMVALDFSLNPVKNEAGEVEFLVAEGRDIANLKQIQADLNYRVKFEKIVTTLSSHFINLTSDEIDAGIIHAIAQIGQFAGVDRSYVFQFSDDLKTMSNTHEWCTEGTEAFIDDLQNLPVSDFPWLLQIVNDLKEVYVPSIDALPPDAVVLREIMEEQSIQSLIVVPMSLKGKAVGFLGFDAVRTKREWSREIIALLKLVGQIFVSALERKKADERLRQANERLETIVAERTAELQKQLDLVSNLKSIIENTSDLIAYADLETNVQYINPAGIKISGQEEGDLTSFTISDFQPIDFVEKIKHEYGPIAIEQGTWLGESVFLHKDGTEIPISQVIMPIKNDAGEVVGLGTIARDIRAQKEIERELQKQLDTVSNLKSIIENTSDFVGYIGSDQYAQYVNPAGMKMVGREGEDFTSLMIPDVQPADVVQKIENEYMPIIMEKGAWSGESRFFHKNGTEIPVSQVIMSVKNDAGEVLGLGTIARDIREQKETERELQDKLRIIQEQQEIMMEMSTPVIRIWHGILILPLVGAIDSTRASQTMQNVLDAITHNRAKHVIIDITGVPFVDTEVANHLIKTVQAAKLVGAQCMLVGISSEVAQTLVHICTDLNLITTFATLEDGLQEALFRSKYEIIKR